MSPLKFVICEYYCIVLTVALICIYNRIFLIDIILNISIHYSTGLRKI